MCLRLLLLLVLAALGGCNTGAFGQFYDGMTAEQVKADKTLLTCDGLELEVQRLDGEALNQDALLIQQYEQGYILLGRSSIEANASQVSSGHVSALGRKLGACRAVWGNRAFLSQNVYDVTTYNNQPIGQYQDSAGRMQYVFDQTPYVHQEYENRYNYMALYFAPLNLNAIFGTNYGRLTDEERATIKSDGVYLAAVVHGSKAERAGLRTGDIVLRLDDASCSFENFGQSCGIGNWLQVNEALIYRDGKVQRVPWTL